MKTKRNILIVLHLILAAVILASVYAEPFLDWMILIPISALVLTFLCLTYIRHKWLLLPVIAIHILSIVFEQSRTLYFIYCMPAIFIFCALTQSVSVKKGKGDTLYLLFVFISIAALIFMAVHGLLKMSNNPWNSDKLTQRYLFFALFFAAVSIICIIRTEKKARLPAILTTLYLLLGTLNYLFMPDYRNALLAFIPFLMLNLYPYNEQANFLWKVLLPKRN